MDGKRQEPLSAAQINGGLQMRRLALEAVQALERVELNDAAQFLQERLFSRDPATLVERDEQNTDVWQFKPMAELLLLELTHLATAAHVPPDERRNRIEWALEMSGF